MGSGLRLPAAMFFIPLYRDIYFKYREYKFDSINSCDIADNLNMAVSEKTIIDSVINNLSCYSGKVL